MVLISGSRRKTRCKAHTTGVVDQRSDLCRWHAVVLYFLASAAVTLLRRRYELTSLETICAEPVSLLLPKSAFSVRNVFLSFPAKEQDTEAGRDALFWICTVLVVDVFGPCVVILIIW